jgi:hypothetical protein
MTLLSHPSVVAARRSMEAAERAADGARKAYYSQVLAVALELGLTRSQALAALGLNRRTGFRRLRELGLTTG